MSFNWVKNNYSFGTLHFYKGHSSTQQGLDYQIDHNPIIAAHESSFFAQHGHYHHYDKA